MEKIKLAFFDMDGCMFDTPTPDLGKAQWATHHQKDYPYQGWWGRVESMDPDVFDIQPREHVLQHWKELYSKGYETRILTSRMPKFEPLIQSLLITHNIDMAEVMTVKGSMTKGERIVELIKDYLDKGIQVTHVHFFDDRNKEIKTVLDVKQEIKELGVSGIYITKIISEAND